MHNQNKMAQLQNQASDVCKAYSTTMYEKLHFISRTCVRKNSTVASGSSHIKIHSFDYLKCFINRINEVYFFQ